ncbi:MAG: ATP-binding cassette domain-containing protein [Candidatus Aphodosoma sp.]
MIIFDNTYFTYNEKPLVSGFSLHIKPGEKVVFYGPSGSGKSTLVHSLLGFVTCERGMISVNGLKVSPTAISQIRSLTAWLPQDLSLPAETVRQLVYAPFEFKSNQSVRPTDNTILDVFEQLGLDSSLLEKRADEISGGQRQRILLATTTLLHRPILLLDEPTAALDHMSVQLTIDYLRSLTGTTMISISHDAAFISAFDRKVLIDG